MPTLNWKKKRRRRKASSTMNGMATPVVIVTFVVIVIFTTPSSLPIGPVGAAASSVDGGAISATAQQQALAAATHDLQRSVAELLGVYITKRVILPISSDAKTKLGVVLRENIYPAPKPKAPPPTSPSSGSAGEDEETLSYSVTDEPTATTTLAESESSTISQSFSSTLPERFAFNDCDELLQDPTKQKDRSVRLECLKTTALGNAGSFNYNASLQVEGGWFGNSKLGWFGSKVSFPIPCAKTESVPSNTINNSSTDAPHQRWKRIERSTNVVLAFWKYVAYKHCTKVCNENQKFTLKKRQTVYYTCNPSSTTTCYRSGKYRAKSFSAGRKHTCSIWTFGGKDLCYRTYKQCWTVSNRNKWVRQPNQCVPSTFIEDAAAEATNLFAMTGERTLRPVDIQSIRNKLGADRGQACSGAQNNLVNGLNGGVPTVKIVTLPFKQPPAASSFCNSDTSSPSSSQEQEELSQNLNGNGNWWAVGAATGIQAGWLIGKLVISSPRLDMYRGQVYTNTVVSNDQLSYLLQEVLVTVGSAAATRENKQVPLLENQGTDNLCVVMYDQTTGAIAAVGGKHRGAAVPNVLSLCRYAAWQLLHLNSLNETSENTPTLVEGTAATALPTLLKKIQANETVRSLLSQTADIGHDDHTALMLSNVNLTNSKDATAGVVTDVAVAHSAIDLSTALVDSMNRTMQVPGSASGGTTVPFPKVTAKLAIFSAATFATTTPSSSITQGKTATTSLSTSRSVAPTLSPSVSRQTRSISRNTPSLSRSETPFEPTLTASTSPTSTRLGTSTVTKQLQDDSTTRNDQDGSTDPKEPFSQRVALDVVFGGDTDTILTASTSTAMISTSVSPAVASNWVRVNGLVGVATCSFSPEDEDEALEPSPFEHPLVLSVGEGPMRRYAGAAIITSLLFVVSPLAVLLGGFKITLQRGSSLMQQQRRGSSSSGGEEDNELIQIKSPASTSGSSSSSATTSSSSSSTSLTDENGASGQVHQAFSGKVVRILVEGVSVFCTMTVAYFFPVSIGACVMVLAHPALLKGEQATGILVLIAALLTLNVVLFAGLVYCIVPSHMFEKFVKPKQLKSNDGDDEKQGASSDDDGASEATNNTWQEHLPTVWVDQRSQIPYSLFFSPFYDSCGGKARRKLPRAFFFEDILVSATVLVLSSIRPPYRTACSKIAFVMLLVSLVHVLYLFRVRPFESKLEFGFAAAHALIQSIVSIVAVRETLTNDDDHAGGNVSTEMKIIGYLVAIDASLFFIQAIVLAFVAYVRSQRRKMLNELQRDPEVNNKKKIDRGNGETVSQSNTLSVPLLENRSDERNIKSSSSSSSSSSDSDTEEPTSASLRAEVNPLAKT